MAVIPLHTATDGLIKIVSPTTVETLAIGTRGLLWEFDVTPGPGPDPEIPPLVPGGKGGFSYSKFKKRHELDKYDFIRMEDDEILIIIKAFMQCQ